MLDINSEFIQRFIRVASAFGSRFNLDSEADKKKLEAYAFNLLEQPDSQETTEFLDRLGAHREVIQEKVINPGFEPKMDDNFHLAERDNYFRQGRVLPGDDEPEPTHPQP